MKKGKKYISASELVEKINIEVLENEVKIKIIENMGIWVDYQIMI